MPQPLGTPFDNRESMPLIPCDRLANETDFRSPSTLGEIATKEYPWNVSGVTASLPAARDLNWSLTIWPQPLTMTV
jgi:hypothetical protein